MNLNNFDSSHRQKQIITFVITFLNYAAVHSCRTAWSYVKPSIKADASFGFGDTELGYLDFTFLSFYSVFLYINGSLADRFNLKGILIIGLSATCVAFGLTAVFGIFKVNSLTAFIFAFAANGIAQSTAWPSLLAIMGNWFDSSNRGFILVTTGGFQV